MPSTASPFGLQPMYHPSGTLRPESNTPIASAYNTTILQFAPVKIGTDGYLALAASGERAIGTFMGVEYNDSATGRRVLTNRWTANTVATDIVAYYTRDPNIVYAIQSDATLAITAMGSQLDWGTATAGNSTTGLSELVALTSTITSSSSAGLRIIGAAPTVNNAWGDTYVNLYVQISEHQDVADRIAY